LDKFFGNAFATKINTVPSLALGESLQKAFAAAARPNSPVLKNANDAKELNVVPRSLICS